MSRSGLRLFASASVFVAFLLSAAPVFAQATYGPVLDDQEDEEAPPLDETTRSSRQCDTERQQDGVILVCRELEDDEAYRSPLPAPTASDRIIIEGVTEQPCWIARPDLVGTPACIRFGGVAEPTIIVDFSKFPEPLAETDAAAVSEAESTSEPDASRIGERIPIDLTEDD